MTRRQEHDRIAAPEAQEFDINEAAASLISDFIEELEENPQYKVAYKAKADSSAIDDPTITFTRGTGDTAETWTVQRFPGPTSQRLLVSVTGAGGVIQTADLRTVNPEKVSLFKPAIDYKRQLKKGEDIQTHIHSTNSRAAATGGRLILERLQRPPAPQGM